MDSILIVDEESAVRDVLQKKLVGSFSLVNVASDIKSAEAVMQRCHHDVLIVDIGLSAQTGVEWVTKFREQGCTTPVIFLANNADLDVAISILRAGGSDLLIKPLNANQVLTSVNKCLATNRMQKTGYVSKQGGANFFSEAGMVGVSSQYQKMCKIVQRAAPMPSTMLLEGESGTGKELIARAIHKGSNRKGNFVAVNCGSVSAELLESELFGHVKGAFTGANQAHDGLFTYADQGTLLLDEIGDMPLSMQVHLLRTLEGKIIRPVGGNHEIPIDVRVLAATNKDLTELVTRGEFREDLFYRLNVLTLHMPALRDRVEDIPLLCLHFYNKLAAEMGINPIGLGEVELAKLSSYSWPGNIRELKNVIERSLLLNVLPSQCISGEVMQNGENTMTDNDVVDDSLGAVEMRHIMKILQKNDGNKSAAARVLGVSRKTLERKTRLSS
jgi:DNA-binding NtrC family response regulator